MLLIFQSVVVGLLKVGTKDLYLFDEQNRTRRVTNAPAILDFYIHESRQRTGLGKKLFQTMLNNEGWTPLKCSIDRPSEKLLGFISKHYGLKRTLQQPNNFVVFEGFFGKDTSVNISPVGGKSKFAELTEKPQNIDFVDR